MASSRRTLRRRQQKSLQRHQLRIEGLETRYALNAAPVLDPSASPQLNSVIEDAGIPVGQVGTLVSDLIDTGGTHNNFSDADGDSPGIAITGTNLQGGSLWYSTDDGTTWNDVGTVSEDSAMLLSANSDTRLAYAPQPDFNGSIMDVVTFKAWSNPVTNIPFSMRANGVTLSDDGNIAYISGEIFEPRITAVHFWTVYFRLFTVPKSSDRRCERCFESGNS
jgi:hypothetical protein